MQSFRRSRYLHQLLGGYLSPQLAKSLSDCTNEHSLQKTLELSPKKIVTLFADIQDFTNISEQVDFENLKIFLDWYTDSVSAIFLRFGGYIDKFL